MNYRTYQQILTRFFEYHNILFSQKPPSRKRGHFTKCVLKRRKRNKEEAKMIDFFGFLIMFWLCGWIILKWINN